MRREQHLLPLLHRPFESNRLVQRRNLSSRLPIHNYISKQNFKDKISNKSHLSRFKHRILLRTKGVWSWMAFMIQVLWNNGVVTREIPGNKIIRSLFFWAQRPHTNSNKNLLFADLCFTWSTLGSPIDRSPWRSPPSKLWQWWRSYCHLQKL